MRHIATLEDQKIYSSLAIFSVEKDGMSEHDKRKANEHLLAYHDYHGLDIKSGEGCYNGQRETCYVTSALGTAINFAHHYAQECILVLAEPEKNGARRAAFYYQSLGEIEPVGWFVEASQYASQVLYDGHTDIDGKRYVISYRPHKVGARLIKSAQRINQQVGAIAHSRACERRKVANSPW